MSEQFDPQLVQRATDLIRPVPNYPTPGVVFKDITPLVADGPAYRDTILHFAQWAQTFGQVDLIAGTEARGFLFGAPVAARLGAGFIPIRKAGKLPGPTLSSSYALEYAEATVELRQDTITPGARVLFIDDVLATGGTAAASAELIEKAGGEVLALGFLLELKFLAGREPLANRIVHSLVAE